MNLIKDMSSSLCRICLLEGSVREVRVVVATILEKTLESALYFQDAGLDCLLDMLLSLLDKDVPDNCKNCSQYFSLFSNFAQRVRTMMSLLWAPDSIFEKCTYYSFS